MKVTGLKPQVHAPSRVSIYVDGRYAFGLSADSLLESKLFVGQELEAARLAELKKLAVNDRVYTNALHYVALRHRSEWEITTYLVRKGVDRALIDDVLKRLRTAGLVDDLVFAKAWVNNRRALRATNKRRLRQELQQKRVNESIIEKVLAEDDTDETVVLRDLVARKRKIPRYRDNLKLMQYLSRQGYDYHAVKTAVEEEF